MGGKQTTCPSNHCVIVVHREHETRNPIQSTRTLNNPQSSPSGYLWFNALGNVAQTISINSLNPSAWGHLNPSPYCDVGRFFYRVFKF